MSLSVAFLMSLMGVTVDVEVTVSSVQWLSCVRLFATPWTAAHQASLSLTNSWSSLRLMSNESVTPSNHLILCRPLLLPPSIFPSTRVFSNESVLRITQSSPPPAALSAFCSFVLVNSLTGFKGLLLTIKILK